MPSEALQTHMIGVLLAGGCIAFGIVSLVRERRRVAKLRKGEPDLFASPRRYRRRLLTSCLLIAAGALICLGINFFPVLRSPGRLLVYLTLVGGCCIGIMLLVLLDLLETGRTLSAHYDRIIEDTAKVMEEIARQRGKRM